MAFDDLFRLSCHAVITDSEDHVLLLKANYGELSWGLPGGALEPGETIHEALTRECTEELSCDIEVQYLSGVYYHSAYNSQAFIFRCNLNENSSIALSEEHSEFKYCEIADLPSVQMRRVRECIDYKGVTVSAKF